MTSTKMVRTQTLLNSNIDLNTATSELYIVKPPKRKTQKQILKEKREEEERLKAVKAGLMSVIEEAPVEQTLDEKEKEVEPFSLNGDNTDLK